MTEMERYRALVCEALDVFHNDVKAMAEWLGPKCPDKDLLRDVINSELAKSAKDSEWVEEITSME